MGAGQKLFDQAVAKHRSGRLEEAEDLYVQALAADPEDFRAAYNAGVLMLRGGRAADAAPLLAHVVQRDGSRPQNWLAYAEALAGSGQAEAAVQVLERLRAGGVHGERLDQLQARALQARGVALDEAGRFDEAVASYDAALALQPEDQILLFNRGNALRQLRRIPEAIESYRAAIRLQPDFPIAHHNLAICLLLDGQWAEGFEVYEWRKRCPDFEPDDAYAGAAWTGAEPIAGKTLFIHPELFLGDLIQFSRYAQLAAERGAQVRLAAPVSMHRLLRGLTPSVEIVAKGDDPGPYDLHCALMSLPRAFGATVASVPARSPYLTAEPERVAAWAQRIGADGLRIGVCWQGSTLPYAAPMQRSFPLAALAGIARLPGVRLISLQKHDGLDQLQTLPAGMAVETLGDDFDAGPDAFVDTAAAIASLDLVITADTAMAHLAGALGARTWIALPRLPDWRWLLEGEATPWYPTARLFRQSSPGDWAPVFAAMERELAHA